MNAQKFTQKSLEAIQEAQNLTVEHQNMQLEQEHLLAALLTQEQGLVPELLLKMGIPAEQVAAAALRAVDGLPRVSGSGREAGKIYVSEDLDKTLTAAERKAAGTASLASTMSVRGPGQYARARRRARAGTCAP